MGGAIKFGRPVEVLTGYRPDNISNDILVSKIPLVLKDFGSEWPIVNAAKVSDIAVIEYLRQNYARAPITTCIVPAKDNGRIFYNSDMSGFNFSANLESFDTFSKLLLNESYSNNPRGIYMPSTDVSKWFPGVDSNNKAGIEELDPIKLLWIGNRTKVAAHYDFTSNLACCVAGRRRFTLFPPEQIANLYPGPLEFAPGGQEISLVNFSDPDFSRFPRFTDAIKTAQTAELSVGDALFLPGMWWHHVEGLDAVNILYTHWWRESPAILGRPSNALLHAVMSLRSLSHEQRMAWRSIFDYYVFNDNSSDLQNIPEAARGLLNDPVDEQHIRAVRKMLANRLEK